MGTIDANRIKDQARRQQIICFKREFAEVAWAAFRSEILPEDMLAELDAAAPPAEQQYHAVMDEAAAMRRDLRPTKGKIARGRGAINQSEARLVGTDFINSAQAKTISGYRRHPGSHAAEEREGELRYRTRRSQATVPGPLVPAHTRRFSCKLANHLTRWYERLTPPGYAVAGNIYPARAKKVVLIMGDDLQFKPVQHSVKLTDEAWAATLERAELESTTASEICERLLKHYLALEEKPSRYLPPSGVTRRKRSVYVTWPVWARQGPESAGATLGERHPGAITARVSWSGFRQASG